MFVYGRAKTVSESAMYHIFSGSAFRPTRIISSDHCRALVCDDAADQRFQKQAFDLLLFLMERRLSINRLSVVDSTALSFSARRELLQVARKWDLPAVLLVFNVPLETCERRDRQRERQVGRVVLERQFQFFEAARASFVREGFDQVVESELNGARKTHFSVAFTHPFGLVLPRNQTKAGG